jgi:hypothetical protein
MPLTESPSAALATYSFRRSAFDDERDYVLLPDRIEVREGENVVRTLPLAAIRKVHLRFDPSESRTYYKCNIRADGGGLFLRHNSFQSLGRVEDRGAAYAVFVRALLLRLADQPGVRFRAGSTFNFILSITFIPLSLWGGWWALGKDPVVPLLGLGLAGLCCWLLPRYRPRSFDPRDPPRNVLPR